MAAFLTAAAASDPPEKRQTAPSRNDRGAAPELFVKNGAYDAGAVFEGTPLNHIFTVHNRGRGDLFIQSVKPG